MFSPIASNITAMDFFVPATTTGFGAVSTDVDQPDAAGPARNSATANDERLRSTPEAHENVD